MVMREVIGRSKWAWAAFGGALALAASAGHAQPATATVDCPARDGLSFLCGAEKPEDLAHIPGTRWLIASGFSSGSGLKLIDMQRKSTVRWFTASPAQVAWDQEAFPECTAPPEPSVFNARGISLRMAGRQHGRLHVVNHGGRESVEIFDVDLAAKGPPHLSWRGCLMMPAGHVGNAVATYRDGTVLVTVLTRPGTTITDFELGKPTGMVLERTSGEAAFHLVPGTELPGNNGLETARDDRGFYVVAFGLRSVALFERGNASGPVALVKAPGFMPDNVHWDGKRLLAAGMVADEPACGGVRQIVDGVADGMKCPRGYRVAVLDPVRKRFTLVAEGPRNVAFNGVSSAVIAQNILWLGSYQADRLAYRRLQGRTSRR